MSKITPFLWFDGNAEEAVKLYTSVFKNASVGRITRYTGESSKPSGIPVGTIMTIEFSLDGQDFIALNGGPMFKFTEAVSFAIECETQQDVDHYWNELTANGGEASMCGWLKDRFGLSWQVVPKEALALINDSDTERAGRVTQALMQMQKIDIKKLIDAADGK